MVAGFGGGNRLIRGQLVIDASALEQARQVSIRSMEAIRVESKKLSTSLQETGRSANQSATGIQSATKRIADGFRQAEQSAKAFAKTDLGVISGGLKKIADDFAKISLAAGGFVALGLRSAETVKSLEIRFTSLLGSQRAARDLMTEIARNARDMGQPITAAQQAAAALLPSLKGNTDQLRTYLNLASRLSSLNQSEGLAGASFAIREALSSGGTDLVSLAERFNISRTELRKAIADARKSGADEFTAFATALDKVLNTLGATDEVARSLAQSLSSQVRVALEEINFAAGVALEPLLTPLTEIVRNFANFVAQLRETNPELLKLAGLGAIIVAGLAPVTLALSAIVATVAKLKPLLGGLSKIAANPTVGAAGTLIGAGLAGVELGGMVTKGLARAGVQGGDFDRIRSGEDPLAIAGERLKQVLIIVVNTFLDFTQTIAKAATIVGNVLEQLGNALTYGTLILAQGFSSIQKVIGDLLVGLADTFSGLFDTSGLRAAGQDAQRIGQEGVDTASQRRKELADRMKEGFGLTPEQEQRIASNADALKRTILGGLEDALFPPSEEALKAADLFKNSGNTLADGLRSLIDRAKSAFEGLAAQFAIPDDIIQAFGDFQEELIALDKEYAQKRLDLLKSQSDELKAVDAKAAESVQKVRDDETTRDIEREIKRQQELGDLTAKFNQQQADAERKYEQEEQRARRSHRLSLFQAAVSLDARAILEENKRYKNEQKTREDAFKDQQTQIERERQAAIDALTVQLQREAEAQSRADEIKLKEIEASRIQELAQLRVKHAEQLTDLQTQLDNEKAAKNQAFIDTYNEMVKEAALGNERLLETQKQGLDDMRVAFEAWFKDQKALIEAGRQQTTPPRPAAPGGAGILPGFASGTTGLSQDMVIQAHEGEIILNRGISSTLRALVRGAGQPVTQSNLALAMAGGNIAKAGDSSMTNNNMNFQFANPPAMSEGQFEALIRRVLPRVLESL